MPHLSFEENRRGMNTRSFRASAIPTFRINAGIVAASAIAMLPADEQAATGSVFELVNAPRREIRVSTDGAAVVESIRKDVREEWSEEKHGPEFRDLVIKKATSKGGLKDADERRLETLKEMRRETLPFAQSYEEFVREYDRKIELQHLIDLVDAYKTKYEPIVNV